MEGNWADATIVIGQALSIVDHEEQPQNQALRRMCAALVPAGRGQWAVAMRHARRAGRVAEQLRILSGLSEGVTYLTSTLVRLEAALRPPAQAITVVDEYLSDRTTVYPLADGMLEHDHGRRLLAAGRRDAAVTWLTSAKARMTKLAATPFAQRVDADLAGCGVRTGPRPRAPLPGLTEREAQVAHLASRRLTNRQIAGQLYVTTKTVEYHLGNIYAKLSITSRTQLRDLLSPGDS